LTGCKTDLRELSVGELRKSDCHFVVLRRGVDPP
jgi:hypothetical protein